MMSIAFDCDAVLFDMDGTIVDSRLIVERMWTIWANEHGLSVEAVLALAHGRRTIETMEMLAPHLATPEEAARLDAMEAEEEGWRSRDSGRGGPGGGAPPSALGRGHFSDWCAGAAPNKKSGAARARCAHRR
jgi:hypothetical protein